MVHAEGGDVETFKQEVLRPWMEQILAITVEGADPSESVPDEYSPVMQATGLESIFAASEEAGPRNWRDT